MSPGMRALTLLPMLAAIALLPGAPTARAGIFEDLSMMGPKFPKKDKDAVEVQMLVKFKASVSAAQRDSFNAQEGNVKLRELKRTGVHLLQISPASTVEHAIARYQASGLVDYAEPNYVMKVMLTPNEPFFSTLWNMHNTGQTLGTPGADIRALQAWDLTQGDPNLVVMVIDTGIDTAHQDLAANIWVNPLEIPGDGIDNDANGYVDDVNGIDVLNVDSNPMDDHGHGTHVAGTIGAVGNNALGVVGVNWRVKLLPCKFLDAAGNGTVDKAAECLEYARALKARGVNIVATNNSYGGLGAASLTLREAIDAQRDILFVAAAGNFGLDNDSNEFYPANFDLPNVVSVAATDHNDALPSFSDFGRRKVHLGAPGVNVTSTTPFNSYQGMNGTSMATPHVAGIAALLKAAVPTRDWRALRNLALAGGDVKPSLTGTTVSSRRANAFGALSCANRPLFSVLKVPAAFTLNVPNTVSVLSINCATPVGPVTATTSAGQTFTLADGGVAPDQAAGDGEFTATFTPTQAFTHIDFTSGAGTERLSVMDLTVSTVSAPANAIRGDPMTVTVSVANPSAVAAPASTANLYLSVDGVITLADTLLGSLATPPLAAGATSPPLSATVTVPTAIAAGPYFVGAIVDPANVLDEGNEVNNARAGNVVNVASTAVDLTVTSVTAPTSAFNGEPIAISATVSNLGSASAAASTLNFYLSTDATISTLDQLFASSSVGALAGGASATITGSAPLPVNLPAGSYYVGAVADATNVVVETNETNNARAAANATTTSTRPIDLQVTAVTNGNTAKDGASVALTATVKNNGTVTAPSALVHWYLSTDSVITAGDTLVASAPVPSLGAAKSVKLTLSAPIPAHVLAGKYTIGAVVDPDNVLAETNEGNNALAGGAITVSYSVDLTVSAVSGPTAAATGQAVTLTATVANSSRVATSSNVTVGFYVSTDAAITINDTRIASATLAPVGGNSSAATSVSVALLPSLTAGSYTLGAIVDPDKLLPESSESNNARPGSTVVVSYGPDLVVSGLTKTVTTINRGQTLTLNYSVLNQGIGAAGFLGGQAPPAPNGSPFTVSFYLSDNPTVSARDRQVGSLTINVLGAGATAAGTINVTVPSNLQVGTYYIGAIVDSGSVVRESDEVNNGFTGTALQVR
jgi:subtilisin family serine protease/subtilase family serine protease